MKELQRIREKYSSAGDLIFRSAVNYLAVCGSAAVANTPIGDPDTPEGRMIECAKEILTLSLSDAIMDTHVWFEQNKGIYQEYLQDALEAFAEGTGFDLCKE